jgi:hypothetical protein
MAVHKRRRHPLQPVEWDGKGVLRFKENPIVRFLLDNNGKFDLNTLHRIDGFTRYDWDQFNQLIGYSVSACPIRDELTQYRADDKAARYLERFPEDPDTDGKAK